MNLLYPDFDLRLLPRMLKMAGLGGVIAGSYGVIHDQITYSISPEYFTHMKFEQFAWADCGFPPRVFASVIGWLASWWVGVFSAWFLARLTVPAWPATDAWRITLWGFAITFAGSALAAIAGAALGSRPAARNADWDSYADLLGIRDVPAFVQTGYIHNGSYLGGAIGLIVACVTIIRLKKAVPAVKS